MLWAVGLFVCQIWVVVGQSYPSCSVGCISAAVPSACNSTDNVCICQQIDEASLLSCLASNCGCADQQTAAATLGSTCASNGVQLVLNVTCAAPSSSTTSSSGSLGSTLSSTSAPTSSPDTALAVAASSTYSAPAPPSTAISTSTQGSTVTVVTSLSGTLATSTAVVVFMSSDSTVVTYITSTHWYITSSSTPFSISSSTSSSTNSSPSATVVSASQGSLISHGLSTGAKAGIGAGIGAAVVAAVVFSLCLIWICRQKRRKTSSIADSDHDNPNIVPPVVGVVPAQEKRLAELRHLQELPSETGSRKPTFSWGSASFATSSHQRTPSSEDDAFRHSVSAEGGQHSPPIDPTAYQTPILGNDGYWRDAQELQGGVPSQDRAPRPAPANFQPLYLQSAPSRPIVPPGKWPPTSHGGFS